MSEALKDLWRAEIKLKCWSLFLSYSANFILNNFLRSLGSNFLCPSPREEISSIRFKKYLASPSTISKSISHAALVIGKSKPKNFSAFNFIKFRSFLHSFSSFITWHLDSKGEIIEKDGFSVVAPIRVITPFSICGKKLSCCALLNLWISSINSIVWRPSEKFCLAFSKIILKSFTPDRTADNSKSSVQNCLDTVLAIVVLPQPAGPQSIKDDNGFFFIILFKEPVFENIFSWPIISSKFLGLNFSANGWRASDIINMMPHKFN